MIIKEGYPESNVLPGTTPLATAVGGAGEEKTDAWCTDSMGTYERYIGNHVRHYGTLMGICSGL